jgi:hypothetical protein
MSKPGWFEMKMNTIGVGGILQARLGVVEGPEAKRQQAQKHEHHAKKIQGNGLASSTKSSVTGRTKEI